MKALAVALFIAGLLLWVRVMFFGVQRRTADEHLRHRRWPLSLSSLLMVGGVITYARASTAAVTVGWMAFALAAAVGVAVVAWWYVTRTASRPSTDPEDDPRYRFQGHVARVLEAIESSLSGSEVGGGRIELIFDGKRYEFRARWTSAAPVVDAQAGRPPSEVVIERVEGDVAFVEPWAAVEARL